MGDIFVWGTEMAVMGGFRGVGFFVWLRDALEGGEHGTAPSFFVLGTSGMDGDSCCRSGGRLALGSFVCWSGRSDPESSHTSYRPSSLWSLR